jgi:diadenosine tetraphosphate (Ap4A) HIT family hydrolase
MECLFCKFWKEQERALIYFNDSFYSFYDSNPVNKGHALIIPIRHVNSLTGLIEREQRDFFDALKKVKEIINKSYHPDGYNIGINNGKVAGQTIMHLHIHLIPRYKGDVQNPVGGIRNVIPGKGDYTKK